MFDELRLEFHPTGLGYIVCRRFRSDGKEAREIRYKPGFNPILTPEQEAEFRLAWEIEQEG